MRTNVAPYGSWASPITAKSIASGSVTLGEPTLAHQSVYWVEGRPTEGGRQVIVHAALDGNGRRDLLPDGFSARTRVHEYGGGAYAVLPDGGVVFSNDADGRVYRVAGRTDGANGDTDGADGDTDGADGDTGSADAGEPRALTPEAERPRALRYADFAADPDRDRVVCIRESHRGEGEPVNEIVAIDLDGGEVEVIATGHDFYAAPRVGPDGRLAYLCWDHPRMPWDGTELWVDDERIAGGPDESIVNPAWSPDGRLHWVSDHSGWWNLYREGEPLYPAEAEFAMPMWVFGQSSYAFMDEGSIACAWSERAFPHLGLLRDGQMQELQPDFLPALRSLRIETDAKRLVYIGASPTRPSAVVVLDGDEQRVIASASEAVDARYVSVPRPVEFASSGRSAHALYYPPHNADFEAPADEKPPLLVLSHGGPTAQAEPALSLKTQFFTSRGFGVVDVNYGGSTGYGRAYRELLRGQWGVVDLEDCVAAAQHLARAGEVDGERLAIAGGSAGGYTTLCALVFTDAFDVGASYYGVADVEALAQDTHKFESRYEDELIPPDKAYERSPIHYVDRISAPVIVFQGLDDPVVPPQQAELIVAALAERGIEHEYHAYEGEAHGFRKADTIIDSLTAEFAFYGRILGFEPNSNSA